MNDPSNPDAMRANAVYEGIWEAGHYAFARPLSDTWSKLQAKRSDFLGQRQNSLKNAIRYNVPCDFEVVPLYGFEITPCANGVFKPLSGHGALIDVFRSVPAFHSPSCCGLLPGRPDLR